MRTWFITGVSRGLGLALANAALAARRHGHRHGARQGAPCATGRGTLHIMTLDLADGDAAEKAAVRLSRVRARST